MLQDNAQVGMENKQNFTQENRGSVARNHNAK